MAFIFGLKVVSIVRVITQAMYIGCKKFSKEITCVKKVSEVAMTTNAFDFKFFVAFSDGNQRISVEQL